MEPDKGYEPEFVFSGRALRRTLLHLLCFRSNDASLSDAVWKTNRTASQCPQTPFSDICIYSTALLMSETRAKLHCV